jgi:hypothetical protein
VEAEGLTVETPFDVVVVCALSDLSRAFRRHLAVGPMYARIFAELVEIEERSDSVGG